MVEPLHSGHLGTSRVERWLDKGIKFGIDLVLSVGLTANFTSWHSLPQYKKATYSINSCVPRVTTVDSTT